MSGAEKADAFARDVTQLAELFRAGDWSELRVEADGFSLLFSRDPAAVSSGGIATAAPEVTGRAVPAPEAPKRAAPPAVQGARDPSWRVVEAPNLGTFYRSPKPGTPPFVEIGDRVEPETEICLLEVMKLFTSVKAGIAGIVREIAANDAELVEGGRPLFYIEPQES